MHVLSSNNHDFWWQQKLKKVIKKFGKYYTKTWFNRYQQQENKTAEKYLVIEVTYLSYQV